MMDSIPAGVLWAVATYHAATVAAGLALGAARGQPGSGAGLTLMFGPIGLLVLMMLRDDSQEAAARRIREDRALAAVERLAARLSK